MFLKMNDQSGIIERKRESTVKIFAQSGIAGLIQR